MADDAEIRRLLTCLLDGKLTDEEFGELTAALRADESTRALYVQQAIVSSQLERLYCSPGDTCVRRSWSGAMVHWAGSAVASSYAAMRRYPVVSCAAALLVIAGLIALLSAVSVPTSNFAHKARSADDTRIVANLVGTSSAQWEDGQVGTHRGAHLLAGHVLRLKSGRAEVRFKSGARLVLSGPAQLILQSDNGARLQLGKLAAHVPDEAHGFLVNLPCGQIIDLGTEFAVDVDEQGDADIHVFQGMVELTPEGATSATKLRHGESRRISYQLGRYVLGENESSPQAIASLRKLVEPLPEFSTKFSPVADFHVERYKPDEQVSGASHLLVKHSPQDGRYEREAWMTFDLGSLPTDSIQGARLVLTLDVSSSNHPGAERETRVCRFGVYGVTGPSPAIDGLTWNRSQQVSRQLLGMFQVRGCGQRGSQVGISGGALTAWLKSLDTSAATLAIVRYDEMHSTIHAFASSEHPELAPPLLEIWHEASESETAQR